MALDKSEVSAKGKLLLGGALAPLLSPERLDRDSRYLTLNHFHNTLFTKMISEALILTFSHRGEGIPSPWGEGRVRGKRARRRDRSVCSDSFVTLH